MALFECLEMNNWRIIVFGLVNEEAALKRNWLKTVFKGGYVPFVLLELIFMKIFLKDW